VDEKPLYGAARIAAEVGVSERTLWRWTKHPGNDFLDVSSISNHGGGLGRALMTHPSSIQNFRDMVIAPNIAQVRRDAANKRWRGSDA
jgi:hypothetical protein